MTNLPDSKSEAYRLGEKYYFTGKECKYGHIYKRNTSGNCVECLNTIHLKLRASSVKNYKKYNHKSWDNASNTYQRWTIKDINLITEKDSNGDYIHSAGYFANSLKRSDLSIVRARNRFKT